jgi:hypothetical protein
VLDTGQVNLGTVFAQIVPFSGILSVAAVRMSPPETYRTRT